TIALRQAIAERLPFIPAGAAAVDAQLAVKRKVFAIALDGDDVDRLRLMRVNVDHESKVSGQIPAHFVPGIAAVVAAHHVPMFLHKEHVGARLMRSDMMNAVADLGIGIGNVLRLQAAIDWLPGFASVVSAKRARRRYGDEHALGIFRIENDAVQAQPARARLPFGACAVAAESGKLLPTLTAVGRTEKGRIFYTRVNRVRIAERWFEMPHTLEFPRVLRAVVPLVRGERLSRF